jgi:hypothetical protein
MSGEKLQNDRFTWVRIDERGPAVRWGRVSMFVGGVLLVNLVAQTVLYLTLQVPFRLGIVSALLSVQLAFLATVIELQRQNLKPGKSGVRFDLTYLFVATLLAAMFFGSVTAEIRASQRGFQRNNEIKTELEKLIGGGNVYLSGHNGKRITCEITRKDFSDSELADLIEASRDSDSSVCEITMLVLEATAVTDSGIQKLSACQELEYLALPPIALSDATLEKLTQCRKLKYLILNQKKLTESQLNQLYEKLPNTKINGVSHQERQAAKQK